MRCGWRARSWIKARGARSYFSCLDGKMFIRRRDFGRHRSVITRMRCALWIKVKSKVMVALPGEEKTALGRGQNHEDDPHGYDRSVYASDRLDARLCPEHRRAENAGASRERNRQ